LGKKLIVNYSGINSDGVSGDQPGSFLRRVFFFAGALSLALPGFSLTRAAAAQARTSGNHALLYWGADDCGPCLAWERDHLSRVRDELTALGVRVLVLKKPRILDLWAAEHLQAETLALEIFRAGATPRLTPHFTYVADGLRLIDIPGYDRSNWASVHQRAVDRLFRKRPSNA
jgi:hypothetical protein